MSYPLTLSATFLFAAGILAAQVGPANVDWKEVRARQPAGLNLKLTIAGGTFKAGGRIDAALTFSNSSPSPYHLWIGTYDRSGRIPDIAFFATDAAGKRQPDPLKWYFERGGITGGLGNEANLGEWKITLPINEWIRFLKPGEYEVFAYSSRVRAGDKSTRHSAAESPIELVSDPVKIRIDAMDTQTEQQMIDAAQRVLGSGDSAGSEAAAKTLRFLDDPRSRAALFPLLGDKSGSNAQFDAMLAYYAAPDLKAEAAKILAAVQDGQLPFTDRIALFYATLKTADFEIKPLPRDQLEKLAAAYAKVYQAASAEITAAGQKAAGTNGPEANQFLITTLNRDPEKRADARAKLVTVQLELTPEQVTDLLDGWELWGGEDFLPLLRKAVAGFDSQALIALAALRPDEARPIIIEDIQRKAPRFTLKARLSLPARAVPELERYFHDQFASEDAARKGDLFDLFDEVDRYGSADLLPEVVPVYQTSEGRWACEIQNAALRFWIRCDAKAGVAALSRALKARGETRCYEDVLADVLLKQWNPSALPVVTAALDDSDPAVVESAVRVLEANAGPEWLEPSITAAERISKTNSKEDETVSDTAGEIARTLLEGKHWPLDMKQKSRLLQLR